MVLVVDYWHWPFRLVIYSKKVHTLLTTWLLTKQQDQRSGIAHATITQYKPFKHQQQSTKSLESGAQSISLIITQLRDQCTIPRVLSDRDKTILPSNEKRIVNEGEYVNKCSAKRAKTYYTILTASEGHVCRTTLTTDRDSGTRVSEELSTSCNVYRQRYKE